MEARDEIRILVNEQNSLSLGEDIGLKLSAAEEKAIAIHKASQCDLNKKYQGSWLIDDALTNCSVAFVDYLLSIGVVFRRGDNALDGTLDTGCSEEDRSIRLLELAESHGYELNSKRANILIAALCNPFQLSDPESHKAVSKCLQFLTDKGGSLNTVSKSYEAETPLIAAVCHGPNVDVVKLLLKFGAKVNLPDQKGFTPIFYACGKPAMAGFAVVQGNEPDELVRVVNLLIENGAETAKKVGSTQTPLYWAKRSKYTKIQRILMENNESE